MLPLHQERIVKQRTTNKCPLYGGSLNRLSLKHGWSPPALLPARELAGDLSNSGCKNTPPFVQ